MLTKADKAANGAVNPKGQWSWQATDPEEVVTQPVSKAKKDFYTQFIWKDLIVETSEQGGAKRKREQSGERDDETEKQMKLDGSYRDALPEYKKSNMNIWHDRGELQTADIPGQIGGQSRYDFSDLVIDSKIDESVEPSVIEEGGQRNCPVSDEQFLIPSHQLEAIQVVLDGVKPVVFEESEPFYQVSTSVLVDIILAALKRQHGMLSSVESPELVEAFEHLDQYQIMQEALKIKDIARESIGFRQQSNEVTGLERSSDTYHKSQLSAEKVMQDIKVVQKLNPEVKEKIDLLLEFQAQYHPVALTLLELLEQVELRLEGVDEGESINLAGLEKMEALAELSKLKTAVSLFLASNVPASTLPYWQRSTFIVGQSFPALQGRPVDVLTDPKVCISSRIYQQIVPKAMEASSDEIELPVSQLRGLVFEALGKVLKKYKLTTGVWDAVTAGKELSAIEKTVQDLKSIECNEVKSILKSFEKYRMKLEALGKALEGFRANLKRPGHEETYDAVIEALKACSKQFKKVKDAKTIYDDKVRRADKGSDKP
ncbi:hypothetical protein [Endozoicomonas sp. OPT23]|uniref:hypothetical protein n=1 Tax=Endozoicomonas sp. OPT23 TaxID=2072845 RepID=UPI00129AABC2|nr:hypothetical protein [Endozoicomonas sp. OPT23]